LSKIEMLEAISSEWIELYAKSSTATPFQAPFWVIPWWTNFGNSTLCAISIRENENLICLAPFYIYTVNNKKRLSLAGAGISDYLDVLYLDKYYEIITEKVSFYLSSISELWDECDFQEIPDTSPLSQIANYLRSYNVHISKLSECSYIDASMVSDIRKVIPKKLRKNIQNSINSIKTHHSLALDVRYSPDELILLHNKRWRQKGEKGVLDDETIKKIHYEVLKSQYQNNEVSVYSLKMDKLTIACYYVLKKDKKAYFYLSGFDPAFEQYSPGSIALFMTIEELFKNGYSNFDFLRGNERYKNHWGVTYRQNYGIQITKL
jgi:CelD/BcsL family acetyltransferase involved in cellulose biosynthesis